MRDLLIIVPTRCRPVNVQRLIDAVADTATEQTGMVFAVDDDDRSYDGLRLFPQLVCGPRKTYAEWTTKIALKRADSYLAIAAFSDDRVPVTSGWDKKLIAALGGHPGVAYGNDLLQGSRIPTAAVVSSSIITALGYMTPPGLKHLYVDNFWRALGEGLGNLAYCPDVVIEHYHPSAGKAQWDDNYRLVNSPERDEADRSVWEWFQANRWPGDLARLRETLGVS